MIDFNNKKVAIVGSSGHLLERNYANLIDSHDIIIRFNFARVEGYEKYVGKKTTHRIVNHHVFMGTTSKDRFPGADPNFIPNLQNQDIILVKPLGGNLKGRSPNNDVYWVEDETWYEYKRLLHNKKDPSAGFIGIILVLSISPKKISLFGFDQSNTLPLEKRHYWEKVTSHANFHNYNPEREFVEQLEKENKIKIYK